MSSPSPWRSLALLLLLLAVGAALLGRVQVTMDVVRLLPGQGALAEAVAASQRFHLADTLIIEVDGGAVDRATLLQATDELGARLSASEHMAEVRYRVEAADGVALDKVLPFALELVPADEITARTSPEGVEAALARWPPLLAGPAGGLFRRRFQADPLDLFGLATEHLRQAGGAFRVEVVQGHFLDASGTRAVLFARPHEGVLEVGPEDPLLEDLRQELAKTSLPTSWYGGHRVAASAASAMKAGVQRAAGVGGVLLLLVLGLGFRSLRPAVGLVLPLSVAVVGVIAAAALRSPVHGMTLGFAAALLGMAVDYWVHLVVVAGHGLPEGADFKGRVAAARLALTELRAPLALSTLSTVGAFGLLATSGTPVVRDLGIMGACAAGGAWLGVVALGPLAFGLVGRRQVVREAPRPDRGAPALVLVSLLAVVVATGASLEGDPQELAPPDTDTRRVARQLGERYGGIGTGGVVLLEGGELDDRLTRAERIEVAVEELGGVSLLGPTALLPSRATRKERRAALPPVDQLQERLEAGAEATGFRAEALAGVAQALHTAPTEVFGPELWTGTPFEDLVHRHLQEDGVVLAVVLSDPELAGPLAELVGQVDPEATVVLPARLSELGVESLLAELWRLGAMALVGVLVLLGLRTRDPRRVVAALVPPLLGGLWALAAMALWGLPWNAVSVAGLVLVGGLGLDYGVFAMEAAALRSSTQGPTRRAIQLSALTTAVGFGPLVLGGSPALQGLGLSVLVGVGTAAVAARLLVGPITRGEALVGPRTAGGLRLAFGLLLLGVNVDLLFQQLSWLQPPPDGGLTLDLDRLDLSDPVDRSYGPNRLRRSHGVWALRLEGPPLERGLAHGALTVDLNQRLERHLLGEFERHVPYAAARFAITRGTGLLAPRLDRFFKEEHRLELQGEVIGRAAVQPDAFGAMAPPYSRKVYYHAIHDIGQALVDTPFVAACTGFMAGPPATSDGHWLLGRNFDFEGGAVFDRDKVVTFVQPEEGIPFVHVSFAGNLGVVSGVNARGIAVALQAGGTDAPPRPATPMTLVLREVIESASSLDEAEAILASRTGMVADNVLVVDADAGEAAVFEVGPGGLARLEVPATGVLGVANHFRAERWAQDQTNLHRQETLTTLPRQRRMDALLAEHKGAIDLPLAVEMLRDTAAEDGSPLPPGHRHAIDARIASHSVVIDATTRTLWVSRAPHTDGGYVAFRLEDGLQGDLEGTVVVDPRDPGLAQDVDRMRALLREAAAAPPPEALDLLDLALSLTPGHPEVMLAKAELLAAAGAAPEARSLAQAVLEAPPEYPRHAAAAQALLEAAP